MLVQHCDDVEEGEGVEVMAGEGGGVKTMGGGIVAAAAVADAELELELVPPSITLKIASEIRAMLLNNIVILH